MKSSIACGIVLCGTAVLAGARAVTTATEYAADPRTPGLAQSPRTRDAAASDEKGTLRWREGKRLIDHGGHFRQDGDGAVFVSDTGHELIALANLNLERVTRTLKSSDESASIRWSVNGVVTEFNGRNYLLIQRAVYRSAAPPPVPEQILN